MSIKIEGLALIETKLKRLKELNGLDKSAFDTIGNMIKNKIELSFEREASPFGERWKPISANTALKYAGGRKKAYYKNGRKQTKAFLGKYGAGGSKKILRLSGDLADNWHIKAAKNSVTVSNNSSNNGFAYGLTHQFGSSKLNIPARPFLPVDSNGELEPKLKENILKFLDKQLMSDFK
ncbi:phage morphogenesis protein [Campylobacter sp. RM12920]|uniref:Phage morphogenesis protein n=1 Tax=Campylobacter californiensis TaxID=1032243 RepID=A0ABD4JGM3_9BACT|nr:phage morphogenesis protein [Campylobacter sp. RM12919]MBE2987434.1 phage morphogenesis protein [Campylobacter sp. RM12920]